MEISFVWKNDPPEYPSVEIVEGGLQFALDHFDDPRGIRDQVVTAYVSLDGLKVNVTGVGWSKDDKERLVVFRYSILNKESSCVYYETPT